MSEPGAHQPESLLEVMDQIYAARGALTPSVVLREATDPGHPLHHRFVWDDTVAGHRYRLGQAGDLIRSVRIRHTENGDGSINHLRAYLAVREPESPHAVYRPIAEVAADPLASKIILAQMNREWRSFRRRYEHLVEFVEMVRASMETEEGTGTD